MPARLSTSCPVQRRHGGRSAYHTGGTRQDAKAIAAFVELMFALPDEDPPGAWEEAMRDLDAQRPHRKLFEGLY